MKLENVYSGQVNSFYSFCSFAEHMREYIVFGVFKLPGYNGNSLDHGTVHSADAEF